MSQHVLIICTNCGASEHDSGGQFVAQGAASMKLLHQLEELHAQWPRRDELTIETTGCLCICDRACTIAFVATGKPAYLFVGLSDTDSAADLLTAAELYLDSDNGMVPANQLPAKLRPCRIARIPPAPCRSTNASGK